MTKKPKAPAEISDDLLFAARKLIGQVGEEEAFQLTSLEMEARASEGDMPGMKEKADLLFAISAVITAARNPVYH
jgi:hypothetical protein